MAAHFDTARIIAAVDFLRNATAPARLITLKNLTVNNGGIWPLPDNPDHHRPAWYEVQLLGISATAETPDMLPINWMRAARNILKTHEVAT